jgi:hypothetical protein
VRKWLNIQSGGDEFYSDSYTIKGKHFRILFYFIFGIYFVFRLWIKKALAISDQKEVKKPTGDGAARTRTATSSYRKISQVFYCVLTL